MRKSTFIFCANGVEFKPPMRRTFQAVFDNKPDGKHLCFAANPYIGRSPRSPAFPPCVEHEIIPRIRRSVGWVNVINGMPLLRCELGETDTEFVAGMAKKASLATLRHMALFLSVDENRTAWLLTITRGVARFLRIGPAISAGISDEPCGPHGKELLPRQKRTGRAKKPHLRVDARQSSPADRIHPHLWGKIHALPKRLSRAILRREHASLLLNAHRRFQASYLHIKENKPTDGYWFFPARTEKERTDDLFGPTLPMIAVGDNKAVLSPAFREKDPSDRFTLR